MGARLVDAPVDPRKGDGGGRVEVETLGAQWVQGRHVPVATQARIGESAQESGGCWKCG